MARKSLLILVILANLLFVACSEDSVPSATSDATPTVTSVITPDSIIATPGIATPSAMSIATSDSISAPGTFITKWGSEGTGDGQFDVPGWIAIDESGNVYVTDLVAARVQVFDSDGEYLAKWGSEGSSKGEFVWPQGMAVDRDGNVYIADANNDLRRETNHRVQKFDRNGVYLTEWGTRGSGNGQFDQPWGIAIDKDGNVYVADNVNHRVQKFDSNGQLLIQWGSKGSEDGELRFPEGIAVDKAGNVYVADAFIVIPDNIHTISRLRRLWCRQEETAFVFS